MTVNQEAAFRTAVPIAISLGVVAIGTLIFTYVPIMWICMGLMIGVFGYLVYHMYRMNLETVHAERNNGKQQPFDLNQY